MTEKRTDVLLWVVLGGAALLLFAISLVALAVYSGDNSGPTSMFGGSQIAVLEVEGIIFDAKEFVEQLKTYGRSAGVKAVVLRLNSPGGGVAASQEMYEALKQFRAQTGKKVTVSMASVAASGAYYLACASDKIFANPGSVTGSIGVIAEWYNFGDLLKWAKMQSIVFKSGEYKDSGSPTRPLTDAEKAYFQNLIDNMYSQFVAAVSSGRKMEENVVRKLADGRVFTGLEAKNNGLVDEIGTLQDAIADAAKQAGIRGEPRTVSPQKRKLSLLDFLLGDARSVLPLNPDHSESHIRFQYLWR